MLQFYLFLLQQVFEQLRNDRPQAIAKLIPVAGDVTLDGLGLSESDMKLLCDNVSIVFNSAATVRFDEELRTAVELNVKGPQRLIRICHKMKCLEVGFCLNNQLGDLHLTYLTFCGD